LRTVLLGPELKVILLAWLKELKRRDGRIISTGPLLATRNGTPMKTAFAWRLLKRVANRAGVRPLPAPQLSEVSCHTLRARTEVTYSIAACASRPSRS
jgi:integrase